MDVGVTGVVVADTRVDHMVMQGDVFREAPRDGIPRNGDMYRAPGGEPSLEKTPNK